MADQTIAFRDTEFQELPAICEMEKRETSFIIPYSLQRHHEEFRKPTVVYKSICRGDTLVGFIILVLDPDGQSVEFRRIIVSHPGRGYGTRAVRMVQELCRSQHRRVRVWLDVFETNERARHVYERCGYRPIGRSEHEGRTLLVYETTI